MADSQPLTRGDLAYAMSMPQAFAAKSQLAFGKQEAQGGEDTGAVQDNQAPFAKANPNAPKMPVELLGIRG